jgi:hypothetical protein
MARFPSSGHKHPAVVLVGCGSTKLSGVHPAAKLYSGSLTRARVAYAERLLASSGTPWFILSAEYGLVDPSCEIQSYDRSLSQLTLVQKSVWANDVAGHLFSRLFPGQKSLCTTPQDLRRVRVEIHAGLEYQDPLREILLAMGVTAGAPFAHLGIGQQLAWYKEQAERAALWEPITT